MPQTTDQITEAYNRHIAAGTWQYRVEARITTIRTLYDRAEGPWTWAALIMGTTLIAILLGG